jgi:hypothetical protein
MTHEHRPHGQNIRDFTSRTGTRYQWVNCECGAKLRRETLPEKSPFNWANWTDWEELGLKS